MNVTVHEVSTVSIVKHLAYNYYIYKENQLIYLTFLLVFYF